jgi:hypothetical protein
MCLALSTRTRDFHPLDCAHARRTTMKIPLKYFQGNFYINNDLIGLKEAAK